jgi:serine/threonine protein kinase
MQQILGPPSERELHELKTNYLSSDVASLLEKIVRKDENCKINIFDLLRSTKAFAQLGLYERQDLEHAADLIENTVTWCPKDRLSAADALNHPFLQK